MHRREEPYADGRSLDVFVPTGTMGRASPVALCWHGRGADAKDELAPLGALLSTLGWLAVVPNWTSDDEVVGCTQLACSISWALEHAPALGADPERIALVGWSRGARMAADVADQGLVAGRWAPVAVVGLAGGYTLSSHAVAAPLGPTPAKPPRTWVLHGTRDTVVDPARSRAFADRLCASGNEVRHVDVDCDHAGIVLCAYDAALRRCVPAGTGVDGVRASLTSVFTEVREAIGS